MVHGKCCPDPRPEELAADRSAATDDLPEIDSRALFGKGRMVGIRHGSELYTLRITRAQKLILTK